MRRRAWFQDLDAASGGDDSLDTLSVDDSGTASKRQYIMDSIASVVETITNLVTQRIHVAEEVVHRRQNTVLRICANSFSL